MAWLYLFLMDLCLIIDSVLGFAEDCTGLPRSGKNTWKIKFFPGREKVREFCGGQGNLERTWKVREKSGNLKINGYGRQSSENLFILFKKGKDEHS